jgi:hypothetical protein
MERREPLAVQTLLSYNDFGADRSEPKGERLVAKLFAQTKSYLQVLSLIPK